MAILSAADLVKSELLASGLANIDDLLETFASYHSAAPNQRILYLRLKYSMVKYLMGNARNYVDTTIAFDQIKASQVLTNLKFNLQAIEDDLRREDKFFLGSPMASVTPVDGLHDGQKNLGDYGPDQQIIIP